MFNIIILTKTWCDFSNTQLFQISGYVAYPFPRPTSQKGGGVSLYIGNRFHQASISSTCAESVTVFEHGEVVVTDVVINEGMYRSPNDSLKIFLKEFS